MCVPYRDEALKCSVATQANRAALAELKAFQEAVRLEDEVAAEAIKEASRAFVENVMEKGIASTKKRTRVRDYTEAVRVRLYSEFWPAPDTFGLLQIPVSVSCIQ